MFKIKKVTFFSLILLASNIYSASKDTCTPVQICKAALSSIMGVDHKTIQTEEKKAGVVSLYYRLEGEKEQYDYKCRVEGSRVIWGSAHGRWRTDKEDALITFSVSDAHITIEERFTDEPVSQASRTTFTLSEL